MNRFTLPRYRREQPLIGTIGPLRPEPEPEPQPDVAAGLDPSRMRIVGYRQFSATVYEITTESAGRGRVTRRVLVLPAAAFDPPAPPTPTRGQD